MIFAESFCFSFSHQCNCFWSFNRIHAVIIWHKREQCADNSVTNAKALVCSRRVAGAFLLLVSISHGVEYYNWTQLQTSKNKKDSPALYFTTPQSLPLLHFTNDYLQCSCLVKQLNLSICRQRGFSESMQTILRRNMLGIK